MRLSILSLMIFTVAASLVSAIECQDGTDNDGDGFIDFLGACQSGVNCFDTGITVPSQCQSYCTNDLAGAYILSDTHCGSLVDDSESPAKLKGTSVTPTGGSGTFGGGGTYSFPRFGAPEEGASLASRVWQFLIYAYGR